MTSQLQLIRLNREDTSVPWGFRLEGGTDIGPAVNIQRVHPGSVADLCGLRAGDHVVKINQSETRWMKHEDAKMEIIRSANDVELLIERGPVYIVRTHSPVPASSPHRQTVTSGTVWQPKLVPTQHSPVSNLPSRTSLEAGHQNYAQNIGVSHNVSPLPFGQTPPAPGGSIVAQGGDGRFRQIKHSSYNSPMGLYTKDNQNQTFKQTASFLAPNSPNSLCGGAAMPRTDIGAKYCGSCGEFIRDVFVKVQGRIPVHPQCLKCCKCGVGLRNVGYFYINEKLYCERHAKQAAPPPEPGMKPVIVYK